MGLSYQTEDYDHVLAELKEIYPAHWEEIAINRDVIPLDMDYDQYRNLHAHGQVHVSTVRSNGIVVGYAMGFVRSHLHYKSTLHFMMDIFYLKPEYRKGFTGIKLFQSLEKALKARGVVKILLATKCHLDRSRMFEWLGYEKQEIVFQKIL